MMQALPFPNITVIPDRRNPRLAAYRRFVDFIKSSRIDMEYPADLLTARREIFIDSIRIGSVTLRK